MDEKLKVVLVFKRETKNTYRFEEEVASGKVPIVGVQYVQKTNFPRRPSAVVITIEPKYDGEEVHQQ